MNAFDSSGTLYLARTIAHLEDGSTLYTNTGGSVLDGHPYSASSQHYDASGSSDAERFYDDVGQQSLFLARTIADDGRGGHSLTYADGTQFSDKPFDTFEIDYDQADHLTKTYYGYGNGAHLERGYRDNLTFQSQYNDTFTGGGSGETFVFTDHFGKDKITDLAAHLTGPTHDTVVIASFASFGDLLAATHDDAHHNAVIAVSKTDSVTLIGVDKTAMMAHPGVFSTA